MVFSKATIVSLMALSSFYHLSYAADLVAPNSMSDGQSMTEGEWTASNSGCYFSLSQNGETVLGTGGVDGTCTLTMRSDGELVFVRDSDGLVVYTSETVSVLGGVIDAYKLHLGSDGTFDIEKSDNNIILQFH